MKTILNFITITAAIFGFVSCQKKAEPLPYYTTGTATTLTASAATITLSASNAGQPAVTLNWTDPKLAVDTSNYKFVIEVAPKGTSFASPVSYLVKGGKYSLGITGMDINNMLIAWGANYNAPTDLEVRVKSSYANNNDLKISNVVGVKASAYAVPFALSATSTGIFSPTPQTKDNIFTKLSWIPPVYSAATKISYVLQYAKGGTSFAQPTDIVIAADSLARSFTGLELYQMANIAGIPLGTTGNVDVRVKATITGTGQVSYSSVQTLQITPVEMLLYWYAPGGYQGWDPATAPAIASADGSVYEGYIYAPAQNSGFHFTTDRSWAHEYGDDGSATGKLAAGNKNIMWPVNPGYYLVKVNTAAMTYSLTQITTWGLIGDATPGGWVSSTPLIYNPVTNKWSATVVFGAGNFKFRANNGWDINLGSAGGDGTNIMPLKYGGGNMPAPSAGAHTVSLDLSNPLKYTYTVQ